MVEYVCALPPRFTAPDRRGGTHTGTDAAARDLQRREGEYSE